MDPPVCRYAKCIHSDISLVPSALAQARVLTWHWHHVPRITRSSNFLRLSDSSLNSPRIPLLRSGQSLTVRTRGQYHHHTVPYPVRTASGMLPQAEPWGGEGEARSVQNKGGVFSGDEKGDQLASGARVSNVERSEHSGRKFFCLYKTSMKWNPLARTQWRCRLYKKGGI